MFDKEIYIRRREELIAEVKSGIIVLLGNNEVPMNYAGNPYYFRQDSTFLYYFGLDLPVLAGLIDVDEQKTILFGDDISLDDIICVGRSGGTGWNRRSECIGRSKICSKKSDRT